MRSTLKKVILFSEKNCQYLKHCKVAFEAALAGKEQLTRDCEEEKNICKSCIFKAKQDMKVALDNRKRIAENTQKHLLEVLQEICDNQYFKKRQQYLAKARRKNFSAAGLTETQIVSLLNHYMKNLEEEVGRLKGAFLPSTFHGVLGCVNPTHRHKEFQKLADLEVVILILINTLLSLQDWTEYLQKTRNIQQEKIKLAENLKDESIQERKEILQKQLVSAKQCYSKKLAEFLQETKLLEGKGCIHVGDYILREDALWLFEGTPVEECILEDVGLRIPLCADKLQESVLFESSLGVDMKGYYMSLAMDILLESSRNEVMMVDTAGLGSSYALLAGIQGVSMWSGEKQVSEELLKLCDLIGQRYGGSQSIQKQYYLFLDDVASNLEEKDRQMLLKILRSGHAVGVYVIASVYPFDKADNREMDVFVKESKEAVMCLSVESNFISLTSQDGIFLDGQGLKEKRAVLLQRQEAKEKNLEVIPLRMALPDEENWQIKSSAQGLEVPIGLDEDDTIVFLKLSSENPYGLGVGDPRVGKSSLMHTIAMLLMAYYAPGQVHIGIGDFKNGAEFTPYAKGKAAHVDVVIDDEDRDAMVSFLRFYTQEMFRRQRCFEKLQQVSGRLIGKYEEYREVADRMGKDYEMPRIVLLIDEFQNLFEHSDCGLHMSALVRQGASYGIHILLFSQRAIAENHNYFSSGLKDYFTSRFVFRCPQSAARSVLAEHCVDTGVENTGIQRAVTLKRGQAICNGYMGQCEAENRCIQVFYGDREFLQTFLSLIEHVNGLGDSVLLRKDASSPVRPKPCDKWYDKLEIGHSVKLHHDVTMQDTDVVKDDGCVALEVGEKANNILLTGTDLRVPLSVVGSVKEYLKKNFSKWQLHIWSEDTKQGLEFVESLGTLEPEDFQRVYVHDWTAEEREIQTEEYAVHVFLEPDKEADFEESYSRSSEGADWLKGLLECAKKEGFCILYSRFFKNLRNQMSYVLSLLPIHIAGVGDRDNVRGTLSDNCNIIWSDFDIPREHAIKAYYYNQHTEKYGKVLLYAVEK